MTGHHRSPGRQLVDEVTVAVIHHVIQVERARHLSQRARIVPLPRGNAVEDVGVRHRRERQPAQSARHGWANQSRLHRVLVRLGQMRHQHVGDQVHARPALFEVVGDDRHAQNAHLATTRTIAISERRSRHSANG